MKVLPIKSQEAEPWLLYKHYAKRMPIIKYAFGLYENNLLVGVVTFGPTPTPAVQTYMLGDGWADKILELNRLCVESNNKNAASFLVARSLQLIPKPMAIVSYADGGQGHVGYIYQATNFIYTGAVTAHDAEYLINGKKTHARTITASGITNPKEWARQNNIEIIKPKPKHRYVYFCGNKKQKAEMMSLLTYPIVKEYPKGESKRYDAGGVVPTQELLFA
jgi:hypothetical protein